MNAQAALRFSGTRKHKHPTGNCSDYHGITVLLVFAALALAGCAANKATPSQAAQAQPAVALPSAPRPSVIYVTDFHLDPAQIEQSKGPLGRESGGILGGQREGGLGSRLPHRQSQAPEDKSQELVRVLSDSIVKHLKNEGLRTEALPSVRANYMPDQAGGRIQFLAGGDSLPKEGWLLTGWFEKVEEGKAAVEATVGFGKGTGTATADVVLSDLAHDPGRPFLVMGSGSRAKKMPGGLVTMNPYVMAAKFVINKRQGMEKDVKSLGTEIAKGLAQYIDHRPPPPQ
jgi:hypothetical protein